jgi:hypothetical protein
MVPDEVLCRTGMSRFGKNYSYLRSIGGVVLVRSANSEWIALRIFGASSPAPNRSFRPEKSGNEGTDNKLMVRIDSGSRIASKLSQVGILTLCRSGYLWPPF